MFTFPLLLTIYAGFTHAFEADHLLAVSSIVSQRDHIRASVKDGIFWGLGHSSTIFVIGILMIIFKVGISEHSFHYFEAMVGVMLIALAVSRFIKLLPGKKKVVYQLSPQHAEPVRFHFHSHTHAPMHIHSHDHQHKLAYGVGLVHGLAGSGALVVLVMAQIKNPFDGLSYLVIFSGGCIAGMLVAAGLFSVPFSKKIIQTPGLQQVLVVVSSLLCLVYGAKIIYDNLLLVNML